jgi:hypothetical protein
MGGLLGLHDPADDQINDHQGHQWHVSFLQWFAFQVAVKTMHYWLRVFIINDWEDTDDIAMNGAASTDC